MEPIERMCLVSLTEEEVVARAEAMALEELKAAALKDERKQLNAQIADHTAQRIRLARAIESRAELRPILCHWHQEKSELVLVRSDTREEVERRPMSDEDRQLELPTMAARAKAKAAKAKPTKAAPTKAKAKDKPAAKKKSKRHRNGAGLEVDLAAIAVDEAIAEATVAEQAQADTQH